MQTVRDAERTTARTVSLPPEDTSEVTSEVVPAPPPRPSPSPTPATEPWVAQDAGALQARPLPPIAPVHTPRPVPLTPRPSAERPRRSIELRGPLSAPRADTPVALDAAFDEDGPLDTDPLTISSSDTVPLFGLAPERVQQPGGPVEAPEDDTRDPATTVAWVLATVALLVTLAVAGALFLV